MVRIQAWFILLLCMCATIQHAYSTHIRAGDLTAVRLSGSSLTYKFTATIYTDDAGVPPDDEIEFDFGTSEKGMYKRVSFLAVGNATTKNIYEATYTFPGAGEYKVGVLLRNRNSNIKNVPNSVNTGFYLESTFMINPFLGINSSPVLMIPPIDFATKGKKFIHNPGAYDPDGDSLAYILTICKKNKGQAVDGYIALDNPIFEGIQEDGSGAATLTLDAHTGDLVWDAPGQTGEYNVAFIVQEWREGILIGQVNRDIQIIVKDNPNIPPVLNLLDTCIVAGSFLQKEVIATDKNPDLITLTSYSELYNPPGIRKEPQQYATLDFTGSINDRGKRTALFTWESVCEDVRQEPYYVIFKAEDQPNPNSNKLVDIKTWRIKVVAPAPDTLIATPDFLTSSVKLDWLSYLCPNATKMTVWRRINSFDYQPDTCQTGLPDGAYTQIGETNINTTSFIDNDNGKGLKRGVTYCYRIYATFPYPKGGESMASMEVCVVLPSYAPYITQASIEKTSAASGQVQVRWTKPLEIDETKFPKPYTYQLFRAEGFSGKDNLTQLGTFAENDTSFLDTNVDTETKVHNYRVVLLSQGKTVDSSQVASTVRLTTQGDINTIKLNWAATVAWNNAVTDFPYHYIYRRINNGNFEFIDSVKVTSQGFSYTDVGKGGITFDPKSQYCYYVITQGSYEKEGIAAPLLNKSQEHCTSVKDVTPPCSPVSFEMNEKLDCDDITPDHSQECPPQKFSNVLKWKVNTDPNCDTENIKFRIYFKPNEESSFGLIATVMDTFFVHTQENSLAGCYSVTAVDLAGNETAIGDTVCNENCISYSLPNVFSPNNDGENDYFQAMECPFFVEKTDFKVYNRWGERVFEANGEPKILWDGTNTSQNPVPAGLYYYEAKIYFTRYVQNDRVRYFKGWITVLREK